MKIDVHCHAFPVEFQKKLQEYYPDAMLGKPDAQGGLRPIWADTPRPPWDHQSRLQQMDQAGVDVEILSNSDMYRRVDHHSPELCRIVNDALAESCRRDPGRFRAFAHIPFNSMDAALKEMARALDDLGFAGVLVSSHIAGRYLHTPDFLPFWEEVNRRKVAVFMHPAEPPNYQGDESSSILGFPFETTLSTMKLLYGGLFERFPDLVLILSHLGGTLPFLARRIDLGYEVAALPDKYKQIPRRPSDYMSKLYVDTALSWHSPAFDCARALVGIDHILYGTDYFVAGSKYMDWSNQFHESLGLSEIDSEKVYSRNAQHVLKL